MSVRTILTLANGKGIDLLNPKASDVDFDAYAEHLAKEKRYNGATPGVEYSVAEHLSRGTDAILIRTGDEILAAYFSLHDGHESVLKDITTPLKQALAELAELKFGILAADILAAFNDLTERHDAVIHEAAGLRWPMPIVAAKYVKEFDLTMFVTEWRDLMGGIEHPHWEPYASVRPLPDRIDPWDWETAKRALLRRWERLLPALNGSRAISAQAGAR